MNQFDILNEFFSIICLLKHFQIQAYILFSGKHFQTCVLLIFSGLFQSRQSSRRNKLHRRGRERGNKKVVALKNLKNLHLGSKATE